MLTLARKKHETIRIGRNITITVVEIGDGRVRLGIEAPKSIPVHREEVYAAIVKKGESIPDVVAV